MTLENSLRKTNSAGWEGTPLAPGSRFNPISYDARVIRALRPTSIIHRVTNLAFVDNINCGHPTARISEPEGYVQPLSEDGALTPQEFEYGCETYMDVEYGWGCLRKMSKEQKEKFMCNDPAYMQMLMNSDTEEGKLVLEKLVLSIMQGDVGGRNQGLSAGVNTGIYNMGSPTSPIPWTPDNAEEIFQNAKMIFNEYNLDTEMPGMGAPFGLIHPFMEKAMLNNDRLVAYYQLGNCVSCPRIHGMINTPIYGFEVMKTQCAGQYLLNGLDVYPVLFGFKDATDVKVEFERVDRDYPYVGDRSSVYEKYWDAAVKVWDGRKLALAWVTPEK